VAIVLLLLYLAVVGRNLSLHREQAREGVEPGEETWSFPASLVMLALATAATAWVSEILVHSLHAFATAVGLSEFFVSVVIVAIVGNAAEHGGAVLIARGGKMRLATEIAISSSAQVALLVAPVVAIVSFAFAHALPLSFRPIELAAMGGAAAFVGFVIWDGRSRRWEGFLLVGVYAAVALAFGLVGDRPGG